MTRQVPIVSAGGPPLAPTVAAALAAQRTLGDVLAWARTLAPPRTPTDIVTQDEYTHDVVLALDDHCWLAYDTT
jgi:hypothetical protein